MRLNILSKRTGLTIALVAFLFSAALFLYFIPASPVQSNSVLPVQNIVLPPRQEQVGPGLPVRLKMPGIGVDTALEYVGLTPNGAMDTPKGPADAGWFYPGPRPGEEGSAVIAGHEGWKNGVPAVFDNLHELQKGDKLYVEDEKGLIIAFVVREIRIYGKNASASEVFNSNDGKAHLNLITCVGVWDKIQKIYPYRLVVFADEQSIL